VIDLDRLRHLSDLGDTQAAAELQRQESRRGDAIPALLEQLRAAFDQGDFNTARVKVFALHCAGYDQLRWRVVRPVQPHPDRISPYGEFDVDLITGKHGVMDHFKVCGRVFLYGGYEDFSLSARRVAFPHRDGLAAFPLLWNQAILDMARAELARYAQHWGLRLLMSDVWLRFKEPNQSSAYIFTLVEAYLRGVDVGACGAHPNPPAVAAELRNWWGRATFHALPSGIANCSGAMSCVLAALDPTATLSQLHADR